MQLPIHCKQLQGPLPRPCPPTQGAPPAARRECQLVLWGGRGAREARCGHSWGQVLGYLVKHHLPHHSSIDTHALPSQTRTRVQSSTGREARPLPAALGASRHLAASPDGPEQVIHGAGQARDHAGKHSRGLTVASLA